MGRHHPVTTQYAPAGSKPAGAHAAQHPTRRSTMTDQPEFQPCRTTRHCADHGWCRRCAPDFADVMSRVNAAVQSTDPESRHWGRLYEAIAVELRQVPALAPTAPAVAPTAPPVADDPAARHERYVAAILDALARDTSRGPNWGAAADAVMAVADAEHRVKLGEQADQYMARLRDLAELDPDETARLRAEVERLRADRATRRRLTPNEHDRAWHAIEGSAGEEGADPGTVLNAVLYALRIDPPTAEEEQAASPSRRLADEAQQPETEEPVPLAVGDRYEYRTRARTVTITRLWVDKYSGDTVAFEWRGGMSRAALSTEMFHQLYQPAPAPTEEPTR